MVLILVAVCFSILCLVLSTLTLLLIFRLLHIPSKASERVSDPRQAILITGCDSGIGLELAKYFLNSTRFTIICGFLDQNSSTGYQQLSDIRSGNDESRLLLKTLDITSDSDIDEIVETIKQMIENGKVSNLYAVINNAGILTYGELDWLTSQQVMEQINVNLIGTVQLTRSMIPFIIESKGRIINVSSVNDATVFPGLCIYSATKSAISTLSKGLGYELRKFGAHVVTIRLGDFARLTNIMAKHSTNKDDMWKQMAAKKRQLYGDYFDEFNSHLLTNYGMTSPRNFDDSNLFEDFRLALLAKSPPTSIVCAPFLFRLFYFTSELMPIWMQYYLLDFMLQFAFKWKKPEAKDKREEQAKVH